MRARFVVSGLAGAGAAAVIAFGGMAVAQTTTGGNAAAGQQAYQQYCASCHGPDAKGGVKLGDAQSADLRWQALGPTYQNDPALVARAINQGLDQDGQALDDVMPRWQGKLTPAQVQDIIAYLQTLTTAVPGQIVATPVHEDVTPQATEEAQESAQATSVIAQARAAAAQSSQQIAATSSTTEQATATSAASEQATTAQPSASAASESAATTSASPAQAPATGAGGMGEIGALLGVLGGALAVLAAGGLWRAARRR